MDSPPMEPKPKPALPSHLSNGSAPLHTPADHTERENLIASMTSSTSRQQPIDLESRDYQLSNGTVNNPANFPRIQSLRHDLGPHPRFTEAARDPRDEAVPTTPLTASRPASPYTQNPPIDFDGLSWPCLGTRERLEATPEQTQERLTKLSEAVKTILECIGEDPEREGLRRTPERYARAMLFFTKGYEENVRDIVNGAVFQEDHDELVIVKDIEVFSLCEHHLVPFTGKVGALPPGQTIYMD
ncbi:MAG: hypothetical protein M1839_008858 [Geoglossum umbratile]|nr:MAG: hypothetical protein M1839_008858 [Geoglossum umbratile]